MKVTDASSPESDSGRSPLRNDGHRRYNDNDGESFLDEIETDPTSHIADYQFSEKQLDWIKSHFRHSGNFLRCYGLKPWDDDDCEEGKLILEAIMEEDN